MGKWLPGKANSGLARNNFPAEQKKYFDYRDDGFAKFPGHTLNANLNQDQLAAEEKLEINLKIKAN